MTIPSFSHLWWWREALGNENTPWCLNVTPICHSQTKGRGNERRSSLIPAAGGRRGRLSTGSVGTQTKSTARGGCHPNGPQDGNTHRSVLRYMSSSVMPQYVSVSFHTGFKVFRTVLVFSLLACGIPKESHRLTFCQRGLANQRKDTCNSWAPVVFLAH